MLKHNLRCLVRGNAAIDAAGETIKEATGSMQGLSSHPLSLFQRHLAELRT